MYIGYHDCAELLELGDCYKETTPLQNGHNDTSMAESFVAMFQNLILNETVTELSDDHRNKFPDIVEDAFHHVS